MATKKLKITHTSNCLRVHYKDLETFLTRVYRLQNFDVLLAAGATHGIFPEYLIRGVLPAHCQSLVARFRTGQPVDLGVILTTLCVDGHIPPGKYVIDTIKRPTPIETYKRLLNKHRDPLHAECVRFKERHRDAPGFHRIARIVDRALLDWLREERL